MTHVRCAISLLEHGVNLGLDLRVHLLLNGIEKLLAQKLAVLELDLRCEHILLLVKHSQELFAFWRAQEIRAAQNARFESGHGLVFGTLHHLLHLLFADR